MDERLIAFLQSATESFSSFLSRRGERLDSLYIEVPAELAEGRPARQDSDEPRGGSVLTNPFIFLSCDASWPSGPYLGQTMAPDPSLSVVLGEYGNGKTELLYRLTYFLDQRARGEGNLLPLAVGLASCREFREVLNAGEPSCEDFCWMLFRRIGGFGATVLGDLISAIREGRILLVLDGLDEIADTQRQYRNFFSGLRELAGPGGIPSSSRIVVSMRLEFLRAVDGDAADLSALFNQSRAIPTPIYFLQLDFFERTRVEAYLLHRVPQLPSLFEQVQQNLRLMNTLRRPLLLKIFGDLASEADPAQLESLQKIDDAARLIQHYIEEASRKAAAAQRDLSDFIWDNSKLARFSVELYRSGRSHIKVDEVWTILRRGAWSFGREPNSRLSREEALAGIHKCPFLLHWTERMDPEPERVIFSHRCFQEYFTARGLVMEVEEEGGRATRNFDELVLNVDMRKFLRFMIKMRPGLEFDDITRRSYGLEAKEEWNLEEGLDFDQIKGQLDEVRITLMHAMTDPEGPPPRTSEAIRWFLDWEDKGLHPGYLTYNYESVAVYIMHSRWQRQELNKELSKILKRRIHVSLDDLLCSRVRGEKLRADTWRMIERILHIAQRLRYSWVKQEYLEKADRICEAVSDSATRERIEAIFEDIEKSVFS